MSLYFLLKILNDGQVIELSDDFLAEIDQYSGVPGYYIDSRNYDFDKEKFVEQVRYSFELVSSSNKELIKSYLKTLDIAFD